MGEGVISAIAATLGEIVHNTSDNTFNIALAKTCGFYFLIVGGAGQISVFGKHLFCRAYVTDDKAKDTEILRFRNRKRTKSDVVFRKDLRHGNDGSFFVLNEYG